MINSVRNTVLSILNKNNYGYISPSDFNQYALQAQMELFTNYFSEYNKYINAENARQSGTDYADRTRELAEVLDGFLESKYLVPINTAAANSTNRFYAPSLITTGSDYYMVNKVVYYTNRITTGQPSAVASFTLTNTGTNFTTLAVAAGDTVLNTVTFLSTTVASVTSSTVLALNDDIFTNAGTDRYAIFSQSSTAEAERVNSSKIFALNMSNLTRPSNTFPAYVIEGNEIKAYPTPISGYGAVFMTYFRYPYAPKWTYSTLTSGEPVFNASQPDYQDFELPEDDEYTLVCKILEYCGISIRETQVAQFAMAKEQQQK